MPIRIVLILVLILVVSIVAFLCTLGTGLDKPLGPCRHAIVRFFIGTSARVALFLLGFYWINVKGKPDVRSSTYQQQPRALRRRNSSLWLLTLCCMLHSQIAILLLAIMGRSWTFCFLPRTAFPRLWPRYDC